MPAASRLSVALGWALSALFSMACVHKAAEPPNTRLVPGAQPEAAQARRQPETRPGTATSAPADGIPTTLAEAHARLDAELDEEDRREMARGRAADMVDYHFGLGLTLRNAWGLWSGGPLAVHLRALGLTHPDDMSAVILDSYWCHLRGLPYDISGHVAYYAAYWKATREAAAEAERTGAKSFQTPDLPEPKPMCKEE